MNSSFVIQAVIQFVTQAVPADAARGRQDHQDSFVHSDGLASAWAGQREADVRVNVC